MRIRSLYLGAFAAATVALGAQGAEVDAKGAADLVKALTALLPEKAVASGFLEAVPEKDHYRLDVDFGRLARAFIPVKELDLSASDSTLVYPPEGADGLMRVRRDASDFSLSARWDKAPAKGNVSYLLRDFVFDGQYDPAIYYFRSATAHSTGATMTSSDGKQTVEASLGPLDQTMNSNRNADGSVDIGSTARLEGLRETIKGPDMPPVTVTFGSFDADASIKALRIAEIADLVRFIVDHASEESLKPEDKTAFADKAKKALPLMSALEEQLSIGKVQVEGPDFGMKIDKIGYNFGMGGLVDRSEIHFGFALSGPEVTGIPQMMVYGDLVPEDVTLKLSVPELNFASAADAFFAQADFNKPEPLTKAQSEAIGKLFVKDGRLKVDVPEFSARSGLYDLSVTGGMTVDVTTEPPKSEAVFDVTARDIDKTIKGIQELGQKIPDLNTASFVLMMAKGMAKNEADGTSHWKVEVSEDGAVKVNGQLMPH